MDKNNNPLPLGKVLISQLSRLRANRDEKRPSRAESVRRWVESLPRANVRETAQQLRPALEELNRAQRDALYRLDALEAMRPTVHLALRGLERHYLGKPLALPETARETVALCDSLNRSLAAGYTLAAAEFARQCENAADDTAGGQRLSRPDPFEDRPAIEPGNAADSEEGLLPRQELATALHRALTERGLIILRRFQLYSAPAPSQWLALYRLFRSATRGRVLSETVVDGVGECSVLQSFLRPVLLAAAQPERLSQSDMARLFHLLAQWDGKAVLSGANSRNASLLFPLAAGGAPRPRRHVAEPKGWLGIDTRQLCRHLEQVQTESGERRLFSADMLCRFRLAWSGAAEEYFDAPSEASPRLLAMGLHAVHYFAAGKKLFANMVAGAEQAQSATDASMDVWAASGAVDARPTNDRPGRFAHQAFEVESPLDRYVREGAADYFPLYRVPAQLGDAAAFVRWPSAERVHLRIGNLIGLAETDEGPWTLALLHSIEKLDAACSRLGLELLGSGAEAFGAQVLDAGLPTGEQHRVFLLRGREGDYLIASSERFVAGQSLRLVRPGRALRIRLTAGKGETVSTSVFCCQRRSVERPGTGEAALREGARPTTPTQGER